MLPAPWLQVHIATNVKFVFELAWKLFRWELKTAIWRCKGLSQPFFDDERRFAKRSMGQGDLTGGKSFINPPFLVHKVRHQAVLESIFELPIVNVVLTPGY